MLFQLLLFIIIFSLFQCGIRQKNERDRVVRKKIWCLDNSLFSTDKYYDHLYLLVAFLIMGAMEKTIIKKF